MKAPGSVFVSWRLKKKELIMIVGEKITLRPFKMEDAEHTYKIRCDMEGNKAYAGFPLPVNLENEKLWIANMYPPGYRKHIYLAIEENESKKFAGYVGARNIDYINRNAEVGLILLKEFRGKGYFKPAQILFYNYLFNEINMHKVYSFVIKGNDIALVNDKKIGFIEEGIIKEHIFQDGIYKDVVFISLYAKDFKEKYNL